MFVESESPNKIPHVPYISATPGHKYTVISPFNGTCVLKGFS